MANLFREEVKKHTKQGCRVTQQASWVREQTKTEVAVMTIKKKT